MEADPELRYVVGPLPESTRRELADGEEDPFRLERSDLVFANKQHFVLAVESGRHIASAGWLPRDLRVGERTLAVACLGGVLVGRSHRGRGLSRIVSEDVLSRAAATGRTHGILLCLPHTRELWAHLGWGEVGDAVTYTDPNGDQQRWPLIAMTKPLTGEPWPAGEVDLGGLPF